MLVNESHTIVKGLTANDAILLAVNHEATEARILLVLFVPFGQENFAVNIDLARDVLFCFVLK